MYEIIIILNSHMIRKILVISNINHKNLIMNKKLNSLITDGRNSVLHEYPHASSYGEFGRSSLNHDSCGYPQGGVGYSGESSYNYHAVNSSYHNGGRSFSLVIKVIPTTNIIGYIPPDFLPTINVLGMFQHLLQNIMSKA